MNTEDLRILIAAQLTAMYLHPGNIDKFSERPSYHIRSSLWIADLILEHAKQKKEELCL